MIPPARRDPREAPGSVSTMDYRRIEGNVAVSFGEAVGPDRTLLSWRLGDSSPRPSPWLRARPGMTGEMGPSARNLPPPCHSELPEGARNPRGARYSDGAEN